MQQNETNDLDSRLRGNDEVVQIETNDLDSRLRGNDEVVRAGGKSMPAGAAKEEETGCMVATALSVGRGLTVSPKESAGSHTGVDRMDSDESLLRRCAEGDSRALEELTRRYQAPLYRFLARMMDSEQD